MSLTTDQLKKIADLKSGERTLLQETHDLVINGNFPDLPEALEFITDTDNPKSLLYLMIQKEEYEFCAKLLREKEMILKELKIEEPA